MPQGRKHVCLLCRDAVALYRRGKSLNEIAAELRVSISAVNAMLVRHGIHLRGRYARATWHQTAIDLYRGGMTNASEIARKVGVTRERVRQVLAQKAGITLDYGRQHRCTDVCAIVQKERPPVAVLPLARRAGITANRVRAAARAHGIRTRSWAEWAAVGHQCTDRCAVILALLKAGINMEQIALRLGVAQAILSARYKIYHRDWPWFDGRRRKAISA